MQRFTEDKFGLPWLMNSFHADWRSYADTEIEALKAALWDGLNPKQVMSLRRDAILLLAGIRPGPIETLWQSGVETAEFFGARVPSGDQWMASIITQSDMWLSRHKDSPLDEVDQDGGFGMRDAVLTEVAATEFLADPLAAALAECVHQCTPDLAFRLFLQSLACKGHPILQSQYARLQSIGSRFNYGEFVVSEVEHLAISG
ncbi:hypothetical protein ACR820_12270 [Streptomyces netropsis]